MEICISRPTFWPSWAWFYNGGGGYGPWACVQPYPPPWCAVLLDSLRPLPGSCGVPLLRRTRCLTWLCLRPLLPGRDRPPPEGTMAPGGRSESVTRAWWLVLTLCFLTPYHNLVSHTNGQSQHKTKHYYFVRISKGSAQDKYNCTFKSRFVVHLLWQNGVYCWIVVQFKGFFLVDLTVSLTVGCM